MTAGLVADPGVDRCGDVWLGEDFGSDSVLSCGVCIGCESDIALDDEASVDFVLLLDLYVSERVSSQHLTWQTSASPLVVDMI